MFSTEGKTVLPRVRRVTSLFATLFIIALATRIPAISFPSIYALHGIFAAPFFAAIATLHLKRGKAAWEFGGAVFLLALALGATSVVMGSSFVLVAAAFLLAQCLASKAPAMANVLIDGAVIGLACYLSPVLVGFAFGSLALSSGTLPQMLLLAVSSTLLGVLGSMLVLLTEKPAE